MAAGALAGIGSRLLLTGPAPLPAAGARPEDPEFNVVVGSPREPLATQGANSFVEDGLLAENKVSTLPLR